MRAIGLTPSDFRPFSLTTITPEAPSQIWLAEAAVSLPFSAISLTLRMPSRLAAERMPSSVWGGAVGAAGGGVEADAFVDVVGVGRAVGAGDLQRDDLVLELAGLCGRNRTLVALEGVLI